MNPALSKRLNALGPLIVLALLLVALSVSVPSFLTTRNLSGLLLSVSLVGAVATTMMLCLRCERSTSRRFAGGAGRRVVDGGR
ncbi:MAG: hypothetical protein WDM79_04300 [Terricaulis sp.]